MALPVEVPSLIDDQAKPTSDRVRIPHQQLTAELRDNIAVVGLGYVGLPTALGLAERGFSVVGYDVSESRLAAIKGEDVDLLQRDRVRLSGLLNSKDLTVYLLWKLKADRAT